MNVASLGLAIFALASASVSVVGQGTSASSNTNPTPQGQASTTPYTAQFKVTTERVLADGTRITHEDTDVEIVNSRGWKRTNITRTPLSNNQTVVTHSSILEPDEGIILDWYSPDSRAAVTSRPVHRPIDQACGSNGTVGATTHSAPNVPTHGSQTTPASEDLGTEMIQGVEARGRRTTTTVPVGKIGNNQPIVRTAEIWIAVDPGLHHLLVRSVIDDPAQGHNVRELVSFQPGDPDESQFQPPQGYQVVDQGARVVGCLFSNSPVQTPSGNSGAQPTTSGDSSQ